MRALLLVHRYLGLTVGALILLWCGSGAVMMYVAYPKLPESRRLQSLTPIAWRSCRPELQLPSANFASARIEMLAGHPVLSQKLGSVTRLFDLESGASSGTVAVEHAAAVAAAYATSGSRARPKLLAKVELDQWTVSGQFASDRPLYHFELGDQDGTELYVSSVTGRLVQATTRKQRLWNWLGSIPHWLYWVELRRHPEQWTQVLVAGSLLGTILTISGLWLGVRRPTRLASASAKHVHEWHHWSGLVFGLFTLSWLSSGLVSVQPWGLLESPEFVEQKLRGRVPSKTRLEQALRALEGSLAGSHFVSVDLTYLDGEPFFLASAADGSRQRFDAAGRPAPLTARDFSEFARRLGSRQPSARLAQGDDDLLRNRGPSLALPVYRMLLPGAETKALYLDAASGAVVTQIDRNARVFDWILALHRLDAFAVLRHRPLSDILLLLLLAGVGVTGGTGIWLGYKRLFVRQR